MYVCIITTRTIHGYIENFFMRKKSTFLLLPVHILRENLGKLLDGARITVYVNMRDFLFYMQALVKYKFRVRIQAHTNHAIFSSETIRTYSNFVDIHVICKSWRINKDLQFEWLPMNFYRWMIMYVRRGKNIESFWIDTGDS